MTLSMPVFYHSSTVIGVDDDTLFLKSISQFLSTEYRVETFNHPHDCLTFFETYHSPLSRVPFLRGCIEHENYDTVNHSPVDFNLTALHRLKDRSDCEHEISIIIVDYAMPEMNGVELCRKLKSFPFKKILLTGEADHRDAVAAFNENVIDRFIRKDSPTLSTDLKTYITALDQQYFSERTSSLLSHLEADRPLPLSDPIFINFFQSWCNDKDIKKFSLIDKNGSFMVVNKENERAYFVVHTEHTLNSFVQLNEDDVSDTEVFINAIKNREKIPFFGVGKDYWHFETKEWQKYFFTPEILEGRETYYWVAIEDK